MIKEIEDLLRTGAARVDPKAPPSGQFDKQFASIWSRLFGQGITDQEVDSLSQFFIENPEDYDDVNKLIRTGAPLRPRPDQVPYFDNEALELELKTKGVNRAKTRWSARGATAPATQIYNRVGFSDTPFIDIDFPSRNHPATASTATGLRGALESLLSYQEDAKKLGLRPTGPVYMTPAGVHYIEEGFQTDPRTFKKLGLSRYSDPWYTKFSQAPIPIEMAKHPSDLGVMAGGKKDFGRIEVDQFLKRRNPSDPGIMARRDVVGLLPPQFSIRTGPKRTPEGLLRTEDLPEGKVADFVKMKIGRLGKGQRFDKPTKIHDEEIRKQLQGLMDEDPRMEKILETSRSRSSMRAATLPKKLRKSLGLNAKTLAKATKLGIPLVLLFALAGLASGAMGRKEEGAI